MSDEITRRDIAARDDDRHDHAGEPGWSERVSFAFVDPARVLAGLAAVEMFPAEERATALLVVFLPGGGVAMSMARAKVAGRAGMVAGPLGCYADEPLRRWGVRCKDLALVFARAEDATLGTTERSGAAAQIEVDLTFEMDGAAAGAAVRRTENESGFVSVFSSGAFQQRGAVRGSARVGKHDLAVDGAAARARAWGVLGTSEWRVLAGAARLHVALPDGDVDAGDAVEALEVVATVKPDARTEVSLVRDGTSLGVLEMRR